jgi:predicted DsbA family dithiol-disulfide isomerase
LLTLIYRRNKVASEDPVLPHRCRKTDLESCRSLFNSYAGTLELNVEQFKKDMESTNAKMRVAVDQKRAAGLGVRTAPTIFVNTAQVSGPALTVTGLRTAVEAALNAKSSL